MSAPERPEKKLALAVAILFICVGTFGVSGLWRAACFAAASAFGVYGLVNTESKPGEIDK